MIMYIVYAECDNSEQFVSLDRHEAIRVAEGAHMACYVAEVEAELKFVQYA